MGVWLLDDELEMLIVSCMFSCVIRLNFFKNKQQNSVSLGLCYELISGRPDLLLGILWADTGQ